MKSAVAPMPSAMVKHHFKLRLRILESFSILTTETGSILESKGMCAEKRAKKGKIFENLGKSLMRANS